MAVTKAEWRDNAQVPGYLSARFCDFTFNRIEIGKHHLCSFRQSLPIGS